MTDEHDQGAHAYHHEDTRLTYGALLSHVRDLRERELHGAHPERPSNVNAVLNTTRSLTAFLEAVGMTERDFVGPEILDPYIFEASMAKLDGEENTARRRRSELKNRVRPKALEMVRALDSDLEDETFGERLERLRINSGLSQRALMKAVTRSGRQSNSTSLRDWTSGKHLPDEKSLPKIILISKVFGVEPSYLTSKIPKERHRVSSVSGLESCHQRRLAPHIPSDFEERSVDEKEEILTWVSDNILSTPKEVLDGRDIKENVMGVDVSNYTLSRNPDSKNPLAPASFISELDEVIYFKTAKLLPRGMKRNTTWGSVAAERADYYLRAIPGALHAMGMPLEDVSLCFCLFPEIIDQYIEWKVARRGGYTKNISDPLTILESLLHPKTGFITQSPHLQENLKVAPGFFSESEVARITSDSEGSWESACTLARSHLTARIKEIDTVAEKGRDPFEAILPALNSDNPVQVYSAIIDEIRRRTPDHRYPKSRAEATRSLMMIRVGLVSGLRSKNLRQLLFTTGEPRTWKELKRGERGELSFNGEQWVIRIPEEALKNETSRAVDPENTIVLPDYDGFYSEIENYLCERSVLLSAYDDPGTFFVKTVRNDSKTAEYDQRGYYDGFRTTITTYGIYNPYTGKGAIKGLKPHGPHTVRHILATTMVKLTGGFSEAAALIMDTEETVRDNYARFLPGERHARAQGILLQSLGVK